MPSAEQRALAFSLNRAHHGVPVTILRPFPEQAPIETRGVWTQPIEEPQPFGSDFKRREPRRVLVLPRTEGSQAPRGTLIQAAEPTGGAVKTWRADGFEGPIEPEVVRVIVVQVEP